MTTPSLSSFPSGNDRSFQSLHSSSFGSLPRQSNIRSQISSSSPSDALRPSSFFAAPASPFTPATPDFSVRAFADQLRQNPLRWGPFQLLPAIGYGFSYSTGLPGGSGQDEPTVLHAVSPGLTLQSKHLTLRYAPSLNYYAKGQYEDSINHTASVAASFGYGDWHFGLSHSYATASQVLIETARQTDTENHSTGFNASYRLSENVSLDLTGSQAISETSTLNNSKTWSTMDWANYQITDITRIGIGVGGGYTDVEQGSDMSYEQVQGRVSWAPRPKLSVHLNGGIEIRQFLAQTGASDLVSPTMGVSASYRPFDYTTVSLSANRGITPSLFTDQITETTAFTFSLSQRLLEQLQAGLSGGVSGSDYRSSSGLLAASRSDKVTFVSISLGTQILKKASVSLSYSHSSNESNEEAFTYDSDTIALQIGYQF